MTDRAARAVVAAALIVVAAALSWIVVGPHDDSTCRRTATYGTSGEPTCGVRHASTDGRPIRASAGANF
jgi:hypothetical protein